MGKIALATNPYGAARPRKHKTMAKKKKHKKARRSGGGLFRNPMDSVKKATSGVTGKVMAGIGIGLGALGVAAIGQNLIPASYREGNTAALAFAGAAVVSGVVINAVTKNATAHKVANFLTVGGVAAATLSLTSPVVLPKVQFNLLGDWDYLGEIDRRIAVAGPGINEIDRRLAVPAPGRTLGDVSPRMAVAAGLAG